MLYFCLTENSVHCPYSILKNFLLHIQESGRERERESYSVVRSLQYKEPLPFCFWWTMEMSILYFVFSKFFRKLGVIFIYLHISWLHVHLILNWIDRHSFIYLLYIWNGFERKYRHFWEIQSQNWIGTFHAKKCN